MKDKDVKTTLLGIFFLITISILTLFTIVINTKDTSQEYIVYVVIPNQEYIVYDDVHKVEKDGTWTYIYSYSRGKVELRNANLVIEKKMHTIRNPTQE